MADKNIDSRLGFEVVSQDQGKTELRRSIAHLPAYYRTDTNNRFLSSVLDPLIQKGSLERLDGFIGKQDAYTRKITDRYVSATSRDRFAYQLEPAVTYTDQDTTSVNPEDQVKFSATYDDYINQIKYFGGKVDNHDRLNKEIVYGWNPAIDYDKLINYREYYWMPDGPNAIEVDSAGPTAAATFKVKVWPEDGSSAKAWHFPHKEDLRNPQITLYRGNTYTFDIDAKGHNFYIMNEPYKEGVNVDGSTSTYYSTGVTGQGTSQVTFTVPKYTNNADTPNVLYYQCGQHDSMYGILVIKTIDTNTKINVQDDIIGVKNYSLRTLNFTNGMKIKFGSNVTDSAYTGKEYYIEGVGSHITLTNVQDLITPESYATEGSIPYDSVEYDSRPYAKARYRPETLDYITINRSSPDQNAWSRYNRWFHKETIEATATALGYTPTLDETDRAKRPIIEFDAGLSLYNHGSRAKTSVALFDTKTTDAFSDVVKQSGYIVDGVSLVDGMRIIFAADTDPIVRNKIYKVNFVSINDDSTLFINLTEEADATPVEGESVFVELGTAGQGKTYYYGYGTDSTLAWQTAQTKTKVNQQPLFNMFDESHVSFADSVKYPNSDFTGAKVFAYKTSTSATTDTVLGIKVKYKTINNVGDIVFDSDHTSGSFKYRSGKATITKNLASGHLHYTTSTSTLNYINAWIERLFESKQRVIRTFIVDSTEKKLFPVDCFTNSKDLTDLEVSVKVNGVRKVVTADYTLVDGTVNKYVKFNDDLKVDDQVRLACYSSADKVESKGIYEVPDNLATNSENDQIGEFTYGQILGHLKDIYEKNPDVTGDVLQSSNLRDKPDARLKGGTIKQHTGPLMPAMFGLIDQDSNVLSAIDYCNQEYEKFYNSFLTYNIGTAYEGVVADRVDEIIKGINQGKTSAFPFFYDDMIGVGDNFSLRTYTVQDPSETEYAIDSMHDMSKESNRAVYVYKNDVQLLKDTDYTVSTTDDSINITSTLVTGDVLKIRDYSDTTGSFIPPTPTKLGLYPKFTPEKFTDDTYITDTDVIRRHDGSFIKQYGDERDDLIMELEKRIYNNIKTQYDSDLLGVGEVQPSAFTSTEFTLQEVDDILGQDFYYWAGRNGVQYINNTTFSEGNAFTYNYSRSIDNKNNEALPGYWRGIYKYFYDTDAPHTRPWEMFGHSEKPSTWEDTYGAAPYTSGNSVLWDAVEALTGRYAKPGIKNYLPVNESGTLLDPLAIGLVYKYDIANRRFSWKFGDHSPAETAWRRSTGYAFSVIKLLAITKPAKFFGLFFDNSRLKKNVSGNYISTDTEQRFKLSTAKYHLETVTDNATGTVTRYMTAGYQPFVVNHLISKNLDPKTFYIDKMKNLKIQLGYKLGGFTDKQNLKVLTDSVSPGSTSGSKFIPDENYKILFRVSNPVNTFAYSGVLIELNTDLSADGSTLTGGYKVLGYSTHRPFFKFYYPNKNVSPKKISIANQSAEYYDSYQTLEQTIPYGHVFNTIQDVVDFLNGYGKWLDTQGFKFERFSGELKEVINWQTSIREFLFWVQNNFSSGSAITVSPGADGFSLDTNNSVVGKLRNLAGDYSILDAGGRKLDIKNISTKRIGKTFELSVKRGEEGLYNIALNTVQKEHILLFDNKTVFSDIIYEPYTGFRQERLKLVGWKTGGWNGDYYAPGFIFDSAQVTYWLQNQDYKIGDTVEHQGKFYVANTNHNSGLTFVTSNWRIKTEKPAPQLIPNFDYKLQQFNDFYNLETNNFDESQQSLAEHLIGYQSRDYLENLFVNDISQYKFYQGYIREKGTQSAIDKLLKAKYEEQDISLDIYPEWMIRVGKIGNVDSTENIQYKISDAEFTSERQSVELVDTTNQTRSYERSILVPKQNLYRKPVDYVASTTFAKYDYDKEGVDRDKVRIYRTAGYPQISQVQHTFFDIDDLMTLDINAITDNDLIWIANKSNKDWDVMRITKAGVLVESMLPINQATQLRIVFTGSHNLSAGDQNSLADYFAIRNAQSPDLNTVFKVSSAPDHKTVIVDFTGQTSFSPTLRDESTADTYGDVIKFISVRFDNMDVVSDRIKYSEFNDRIDSIGKSGDKIYADTNTDSLWNVYEKVDPYTTKRQLSPSASTSNQDFGYQIVARNDGRTLIASAPTDGQGKVHFLFRNDTTAGTTYRVSSSTTTTAGDDNTGKLGYSLSMSTDENFVVAGAPFANSIGSDGSTRITDGGLIKIFVWDPATFKYTTLTTRTPPVDTANQNYGWAHKICEPGLNSVRSTATKYMFVSAPGENNDQGTVYMYEWGIGSDGSTYDTWRQNLTITSADPGDGKRFGHRLQANDNGDILAVSSVAPGQAGKVEIYIRASQSNDDSVDHAFTLAQTLTGVNADGSTLNTSFGDTLSMNKDGTTLIVGSPGVDDESTGDADTGAVYYYKWNADGSTNTYTLQQTIKAPDNGQNMRFGSSLDINDEGDRIVIGAEKFANAREMKFDSGETTFDLQDTNIVDLNVGSGGAYTATKYNTKFLIDDRLVTTTVSENDDFGRGVCVTEKQVVVGAPDDEGHDDSTVENDGTVTIFDLDKVDSYAWKSIASETALIDIDKLGKVFLFNSGSKQITDYLELYDPVKGRILGVADREINIKTEWDPAQYNFGVNANSSNPWLENHIGEVWWDLSKVKWLWYEQGSQEYKTNNWGNLFPGSSVDVYEWVESLYLPSEYALRSGTADGTSLGITGTPLAVDDSRYSIKQKYNSATDSFVNYYYFWVKNTTTLPNNSVVIRKNTTAYVANLIKNPLAQEFSYYAPTDTDKLIIFNSNKKIKSDDYVINIDVRTNTFDANAHSIWRLVREGDRTYRPALDIEKQWWDSLIGSNEAGNKVPDPDLPINERYGNTLRPRQSWYVNRYDALKEIIDYSNSVLKKTQLAGQINFDNLNSKDPEPTEQSLEWDASVDTYADLTYIDTKSLSGTVNYLVKADETIDGYWAIYQWDGSVFSRTKTQAYNTSKFWEYTDWYGTDPDVHEMIHSENTPIDKQVTFEYELDTLDLAVGKHVKVTQSDTGGWKLFMKVADGWTNVGTENGTIRLSTKLYDYSQEAFGFADLDVFDDNFFDQEPAIETRKVLTALRDDILINDLAVEYNTLFFTGLRKVLSEQTYVDWMFKTSFINATNSVRKLDQRRTYTIGTDTWVESYINEVKPFHTKLREYKLGYQGTDTQDGIYTDFDNPPFYDVTQSKIRTLNVDSDVAKLTKYPWQMWNDYHKKHVESITLISGGSGYSTAPTVTILGGTTGSTGPFQIYGTSSSGATSGSLGYYYPLFTSELQAKIYDEQNGGSGAAHSHTFVEYTTTFYMPTGSMNHAVSTQNQSFKMYTTPDTVAATATAVVADGKVTKINLVTKGSNYTTTPTIVLTGGASDGSTPTDTAKAYANINNDLVRDFDTTIKFDRVSSSSRVQDWTASTSYAYGDLIRYQNELYRVTSAFSSSTKFNDNINDLYKIYGDETGFTAADRIAGFYTPGAGMPGNELSQVMTGVDYGGTIVTGLLFTQEGGWDKAGWFDFPWDTFGKSRIQAFRADGLTAAFTFDEAPSATDVFQVYQTRDDSTRELRSEIFRGDGTTKTFVLPEIPDKDALIEFVPFDDDGVLTPGDDRTLDSIIKGGLFNSALGSAPSDIVLEGDGFINPDTSYAPEEVVPGQMFDTVDIKVYTSPESGVPFISDLFSRGDGSTTVFPIGDFPGTLGAVTVTVGNDVKKLTTDYTVQVNDKTITFVTAPAAGALISTKTFAISGENFRVLDQYTGDGSTVTFTTNTRGEFNLDSTASEIFVTIEGVPTTAFTTSTTANTITVTFSSAPAANKLIQIAGFNKSATSTRSYASVRNEKITFDGSTTRYTLTYPPGSIGPFSALTIIEVNGKVLRGPDVSYYLGDGSTYVYGIVSGLGEDSTVDPEKTITSASQLQVHVNGTEKILNTDYTVDISNQQITLVTAPSSTDVVAVTTLVDNQYSNVSNDIIIDTAQISSDGLTLNADDVLSVTTFNNALGMKLRREVLAGKPDREFKLRFDTLNGVYTYVWLNGVQLIHNADYSVSGNTISIHKSRTISTTDRLDVLYFAVETAGGATGFRIFKDMLNRMHYKRIAKAFTTKLKQDLISESTSIEVTDGTVLATPNAALNTPGVIFIDKERIEYFTKSGDTLGQLRRGTLGTGIKDHSGGTRVVDASGTQTIPYSDTVYTNTHTGDGSSVTFTTTVAATSASQLDIFIGGQRLLLTSEDGSTINYSVDGSTAAITLSTAPADGTQIKILMKKGQVWYSGLDGNPADGKGLQASTTAQAKFIAQEPTNAPE